MRWTPQRFWILTAFNAAALGLLFLVLCGMFLAMAAMAPEIESWPLLSVAAIGLLLTPLGLSLTRKTLTATQHWVGLFVHGGSLIVYLLLLVFFSMSWLRATRRTFLIPDGYKGDVYVLHVSQPKPLPNIHHWRTTYRVPLDGVLVIGDPMPQSTNDDYDYEKPDGNRQEITDHEWSTVSDTAANRANTSTPIIFFPRTGSFSSRSGCTVQFEEVYVGTKSNLLTDYKQTDIDAYVTTHRIVCDHR